MDMEGKTGRRRTDGRAPRRSGRGAMAVPTVLALLAVLAAGVLVSACSPGSSTPGVASLPGHTATTTAGSSSAADLAARSDRDMVTFARCMRGHGVPVADPVHLAGHDGLSIQFPPENASTSAAYGACNHFIAKDVAAKNAGAAAQTAPHLQALTNYASCMRNHDISMPDPRPDGELNLGPVPGLTSDFGRYSPQFRSADAACRHLLPAGVRDNGTGP